MTWTFNRRNLPNPTPAATLTTAQPIEKSLLLIPATAHDDLTARLRQTLEREAASNRLTDFHVSVWSEPLTETETIQQAAESASATWVIYSSSQTNTLHLSHADMSPSHFLSPAYQINLSSDIPSQLRALALLSLGEMNRAQAHEFLAQAYNLDPGQLQQQPQLWAQVAMWLCRSYAVNQQPQQALTYCQAAIDLDPQPAYLDTRALVESLVKGQKPYYDAILTKLRHELEP
jgi:tetratricopeptide (TPR) repeat protein